MRRSLAARHVGPAAILVLVVAQAAEWAIAKPAGEPSGSHYGQLFGVESILLLSIGLVLLMAAIMAASDGSTRPQTAAHKPGEVVTLAVRRG
jgi:hypothetical protein